MRNSPRSIDNKRAKSTTENQKNGEITEFDAAAAANVRIQQLPNSQSESERLQEPKISNNNSESKDIIEEEKDDGLLLNTKFPMNRINRIVRSGAADDSRLTHEAVFLINKASECFLALFSEGAYAGAVQDHKSYIAYKNLSSIVSKQRRYDFLSDFIPEKIKAEVAQEERKSAGA